MVLPLFCKNEGEQFFFYILLLELLESSGEISMRFSHRNSEKTSGSWANSELPGNSPISFYSIYLYLF